MADLASSALIYAAKRSSKKLKRKVVTPPIAEHIIKRISSDNFLAGFSSCEVMPSDINKTDYWIAGHGPGKKIEGVHDPITANAMWLECENNGGILFISIDCIGLTRVEVAKIRDRLSGFYKKNKCISINIICTHNHAGFDTVGYWGKLPKTGKNDIYMTKLMDSVVSISEQAYKNRKSGALYVGTTHVPQAQFDRRAPEILHDMLTRIRFVPTDGSDETWILNFAAHPNTLGGNNRLVSADYPYYLRKTINESQSVNILFGVGAIGAVDPGNFCEDRKERTRIQGECLGKAALKIDNDVLLDCYMSVLRQPFYCPVDNSVLAFLASLKVMSSKPYPSDIGELGVSMKTEMTYMNIGGQKILLLPGENFPETVYGGYASEDESSTGKPPEINPRPLIEIAGDKNLLVFGVSNDMTGYVVPPNDFVLNQKQPYLSNGRDRFGNSHYHETNSLGFLTQKTIADVFARMVERFENEQ